MRYFTVALLSFLVCQIRCSPTRTADDLGEIVFASVLFRHGDRNPTETYPTDPYGDEATWWPRGFGQLTPAGEERHYELGTFLRKRYANFLPYTYNVNDTYVRSSDIDRTIVSARCNLQGLYPPTEESLRQANVKFQVLPIHTAPIMQDSIIWPFVTCPKYFTLASLLTSSEEYTCIQNIIKPTTDEVNKYSGATEFSAQIYDTLFVETQNNLELPEWTAAYYPEPLESIQLLESFIAAAGTKELQRLSAGPLINDIISNMENKINRTLSPDRKLYYYSAHDNTLVNVLQALDIFDGLLVPYAAAVIFELRTIQNEFFVTVSYRNETGNDAYLLQLPGCDSLCPFNTFVELTGPIIPDDIDAECAEEVPDGYESDFQIPAAAIPEEWESCFTKPVSADGKFKYISMVASTKTRKVNLLPQSLLKEISR